MVAHGCDARDLVTDGTIVVGAQASVNIAVHLSAAPLELGVLTLTNSTWDPCRAEPRELEGAVRVVHDAKAAEVAAGAAVEDSEADALASFLLLHVDAEQARLAELFLPVYACQSGLRSVPSRHNVDGIILDNYWHLELFAHACAARLAFLLLLPSVRLHMCVGAAAR